jgi:hypothetical protein
LPPVTELQNQRLLSFINPGAHNTGLIDRGYHLTGDISSDAGNFDIYLKPNCTHTYRINHQRVICNGRVYIIPSCAIIILKLSLGVAMIPPIEEKLRQI